MDIQLLRSLNLHSGSVYVPFFVLITNIVTYVCLIVLCLLIGIRVWRKYLPYFIGSFLLASAVATLLKYAVNRPRPFIIYPFIEKLTGGGSPSFPSGHTTDAFMLATAIALASKKWYVIIPVYSWAILVGYSRMCLGVHYPSDVIAGIATGCAAAILCYKYYSTSNTA